MCIISCEHQLVLVYLLIWVVEPPLLLEDIAIMITLERIHIISLLIKKLSSTISVDISNNTCVTNIMVDHCIVNRFVTPISIKIQLILATKMSKELISVPAAINCIMQGFKHLGKDGFHWTTILVIHSPTTRIVHLAIVCITLIIWLYLTNM